jgi:hypothetical protein
MKRLALVAAFFAVAACSRADETAIDTTTPAMAPATTPTDTGMKMDTSTKTDTTKAKRP